MSNLTCPKCGGSDYFLSKRNIVKGMGWAQRGSLKSVPVCRVCDEIMDGAQVGMPSWEDLGSSKKSGYKFTKIDYIIYLNAFLWLGISFFVSYDSSFYNVAGYIVALSVGILVFRVGIVAIKLRNTKRNK
jgi:hypothetical protein